MFWIATAAALAANGPHSEAPATPQRQAQAVVRIVKAARIQLGEGSAGGDQQGAVRNTHIRDGDGAPKAAVLIEFT